MALALFAPLQEASQGFFSPSLPVGARRVAHVHPRLLASKAPLRCAARDATDARTLEAPSPSEVSNQAANGLENRVVIRLA